ncbi:hypothetical protein, partial [Limnohabitans sp.]|uniref:hypothetical protein n=1 Tax=Limnohabitans sp. TaxID=1907725 RepID=UPI0031FCD657
MPASKRIFKEVQYGCDAALRRAQAGSGDLASEASYEHDRPAPASARKHTTKHFHAGETPNPTVYNHDFHLPGATAPVLDMTKFVFVTGGVVS